MRPRRQRLGDLDDPLVFEPRDDSDRLHRLDEGVHLVAREEVLLDLVGDNAKAGLFHGQPREGLCLRSHGGGHLVHDGVDLGL